MRARSYTVIYDGTCAVCSRIAEIIGRWGQSAVEVIPSQTAGLQSRFPWITAEAYAQSLQLVGTGGNTWQGAAAIEQLLTVLPRGRLIKWIFHLPFVRPLADRFYRWFARHRYRLGCSDHCKIQHS